MKSPIARGKGALELHRSGVRWKLSIAAVAILVALILLSLACGTALLVLQLQEHRDDPLESASAAIVFLVFLLASMVAGVYLRVGSKAVRPSQLHLHGVILLLSAASGLLYLIGESFRRSANCIPTAVVRAIACIVWVTYKSLFFSLMKEKMSALEPATGRCSLATVCGRGLVWATFVTGLAGGLAYATAVILLFGGQSCEEVLRREGGDTLMLVTKLLTAISSIGAFGVLTTGCGMMCAACRLTSRALARLLRRRVAEEELARVKAKVGQHLFGILVSLGSTVLVLFVTFFDALNLSGFEENVENLAMAIGVGFDLIGDVSGILLLSGIGVLAVHEDPDAGDISSHIRGLLQSAVLTSRAEITFEGCVAAAPGSRCCIASFPGKFLAEWHALTWACERGDLSAACVFLPVTDRLNRFGQHAERPETPGKCWCHTIYGEDKPWGCMWWTAWLENIERAVGLGLQLVVVFFPGEVGEGLVQWEDLTSTSLWDGVGLGGSQKAEVAYLRMRGLDFIQEDVSTCCSRFGAK